jgi:hypothetical protein
VSTFESDENTNVKASRNKFGPAHLHLKACHCTTSGGGNSEQFPMELIMNWSAIGR